ncbi:hypothetical protein D4R78_03480 [bacterium]|nr:MAG: hypothetical protein D4R78_03480 [bacterium]
MKKGSQALLLIAVVLISLVMLFRKGMQEASIDELYLASAIFILSMLPFILYFSLNERNIPYVPIFGLVYFVYFSLSIFNNYTIFQENYISQQVMLKTLTLCLWGIISFLVSFYGSEQIFGNALPHFNISFDVTKVWKWGLRLTILGLAVSYYTSIKAVPVAFGSIAIFLDQLTLLGMGILFMTQLEGKLSLRPKMILWFVFIPIRFSFCLATGGFSTLVYETAIFVFIYLYCRQKIPWLFIIIIIIPYILIWGARDAFRKQAWTGEYQGRNPFAKAFLYIKLIQQGAKEDEDFTYDAYGRLSLRTNHFVTFAKTVELTPDYIPYWEGYSYRTLTTSFLPRFLFPDKPKKIVGQEFGHRYDMLNPDDVVTSYNLPMPVEMYINFGPLGVVIGMFIIGLLVRIVYTLFNHPRCGEGGFLISAMVFMNLLNLESDFSLVFGSLVQHLVLFYLIVTRLKMSVQRIE